MMEAIHNSYDDNDRVPIILKGFDSAMRKFLVDNCGPQLSQSLDTKIRGSVLTGDGIGVTGKQALKHLVTTFSKSRDNQIQESILALMSFSVPDGAGPFEWENAFANYNMRVAMATGNNAGDEEKNASILLATLVMHLNNSPYNALNGLRAKLQDQLKRSDNTIKSKQLELAW